jgi:nucleotide-binding universal stress UspA family protein
MTDRIVVPLDGSETAESILPQVRRLVRRSGAEVILARVEAPLPAENGAALLEAALQAATRYLEGVQAKLEGLGLHARVVVRAGGVADGILGIVQSTGATLIAMATHGRTGLSRLLFGSVAERVLRESPVPVLLLRPFWSYELLPGQSPEEWPLRTILLPVDGSGLALCSVPAALRFAKLFDAEVVVLHVLEPGEDPGAVRGQLDDVRERFALEGVRARTALEQGRPAEAILAAARNHRADLIALSTHGRSGLSRLAAGSVAEAVARGAKTPLLVVRGIGTVRATSAPAAASSRAPRGSASSR